MKAAKDTAGEFQKFDRSQWDDVFEMSEMKPKVDSQYSSPITLSQDAIPETCYNYKYLYQKKSSLYRAESSCDEIPSGQRYLEDGNKEINSMKQTRDIGTMTDHSLAKYPELETKGNKLFGQMVACEISNIDGKARYDKMREIIGLFQTLNH